MQKKKREIPLVEIKINEDISKMNKRRFQKVWNVMNTTMEQISIDQQNFGKFRARLWK